MRFLYPELGWWLLAAFIAVMVLKAGVRWRMQDAVLTVVVNRQVRLATWFDTYATLFEGS